MKKVRILSLALALGVTSLEVSCSRDSTKDEESAQNATVDDLYSIVRTVENDLSQGYLLRSANDNERKSFTDVLYSIKIATMRLRKDVHDANALSALYLASQEYDKLAILEQDGSQLDGLKQQLRLTLDQIAALQGKTLDGVERVLFEKYFDYELAPFAPLTASNKTGWQKKNHNELHYAIAEGSKLNTWLFSPRFDLTNVQNPSFTVKQAINSRGNPYSDSVFFMVSANYEGGDPSKADWDSIQVNRLPDGNGFTVVETENVSLAKYAGKKIVLALHYDSSTATTYPTWQINNIKLFGSGTLATGELNLAGAVITGAGTVPTVAAVCTTNPSAKPVFSYQFNKSDLGKNFAKKEDAPMISTAYTTYPDVVRFSGYNGADKPNKVGTSWLISKSIALTGAKDVCFSYSEEAWFPSGGVDLSMTEVLVSADYAGDANKATWKNVEITGRKAATGVVKATALAPKPVGIMLKDLGLENATNLTVAFRYKSDAASAPWWAIGDVTVTAIPAGQAPLIITPVDQVAGGTTNGGTTNGGTTTPAFVAGKPVVAASCANLKNGKDVLSHQFLTPELGGNFSVIDTLKNLSLPDPSYYPGFIRFSGFGGGTAEKPNRIGTSWLVSKTLDLTNAGSACLSVAEDIYSAKDSANSSLSTDELAASSVVILASTDYAGDVNTATWKTVDLKGRKIVASNIKKGSENPKANAINLKDVIGADAKKVTIAFKYTAAETNALWWGIADVTVREVPKAANAVTETPVTPVEPETPAEPTDEPVVTEPAAPSEESPTVEPATGNPAEPSEGSTGTGLEE